MNAFFMNLGTVAMQVFILFLLMTVGFSTGKFGIFNDSTAKRLSDFCLKFATPAVIIKSFIRAYNPADAKNLLFSLLAAVICHIICIAVATAMFRGKDLKKRSLLRCSAVLSNAGFMAMPLQAALLGSDGTFYGAAYVIVLTLFIWTYALVEMSAGSEKMNLKKIIINPGVIAVLIGLPIFLLSVKLPEPISATINHVANLNTPLPMIVVGYYLSKTSLKKVFQNRATYAVMAARLLISPLLCLGVLYLLRFSGTMLTSTVIAASAPVAVACTMFAAKFGNDTELSANMVSVSTLFSIATMPVVVALAQTLA